MWPFRKKVRQRRLEIRKSIAATGVSRWHSFRQAGGAGSVLLALAFFAGVVAMDVWPVDPFTYRTGQYVPQDVRARVSFPVRSREGFENAQSRILKTTAPVFRLNSEVVDEILAQLRDMPGRLQATTQPADVDEATRTLLGLDELVELEAWRSRADGADSRDYRRQVQQFARELQTAGIVRADVLADQREKRQPQHAMLVHKTASTIKSIDALIALDDQERLGRAAAQLAEIFDEPIRDGVRAYLLAIFRGGKVLYVYDDQATRQDILRQLDELNANPPGEFYQAGQVLVRGSRRQTPTGVEVAGLSSAERTLLWEEHKAYTRAEMQAHPWRIRGRAVGRSFVLLLVTIMLCLYIALYRPRIVKNHLRGLAIVTLGLLALGMNKAIVFGADQNPHLAVFAVMTAGIILAIAYDQRFAFAVGAFLAVYLVLQMRSDLPMTALLMTALAASVFQLHEIRTRSKLIAAAAVTACIVFAAAWAVSLATALPWRFALVNGAQAAGGAMLAGFVVQGILPIVERVFRVVTSMTLLEWCDASKPLLKRLAMEAPGTYNHSLQLGTMSESAAESIGARGLLARVGAYYHDIGKINKSTYFIENQAEADSKHAKLSPAMSLLVITGHVKDGLELAREYGLPPVLHEFIASHHGTTLVEYFYHAATQQRKDQADRTPDEVEFRYPGPKPKSKEAAILMLADAAESSVRALSEPTPSRIENQVHLMVTRRLMDGQLDKCDLTLREVHAIETSLVKSLCGFYHARIAYPSAAGKSAASDEPKTPAEATPNGDAAPTDQHEQIDAPPAAHDEAQG